MKFAKAPQILLGLCAISYSINLAADLNKYKDEAMEIAKGMLNQSGSVDAGFKNKQNSYNAASIADSKVKAEAKALGKDLKDRSKELSEIAANKLAQYKKDRSKIATKKLVQGKEDRAAASFILEAEQTRKRIKDIKKSELFKRSEETINNPKDSLAAVENSQYIVNNKQENCVKVPINPDKAVEHFIKECEITRDPEAHTCMHRLHFEIQITPAKYYHHWCRCNNHDPDDPRCSAKVYYNPARKHKDEKFKNIETWISECAALNARPECKVIKTECIDGPSTKTIKCKIMETDADAKTPEDEITKEKKILRKCWLKKITYACQYPISPGKDCAILSKEGCEAINSKCIFSVKGKCYKWQQSYECIKKQKNAGPKFKLVCNQKNTFCLHGECFKQDYNKSDANNLGEAIANLQVFKEIQDDLTKGIDESNGKLLHIFKGKAMGCEKAILTFWQDCCKLKGWFKKDCGEEAEVLREKRKKILCHRVGRYCSKRTRIPPKLGFKVCVRKKTTFCCFTSRLMLAIHKSGRRQLGISWGSAENPDCRGLTPDELSRMDFSKVDLSFLYADIKSRLKHYDMKRISDSVNSKISDMQHSLTPIRKTKEGEC